MEFEKDFKEWLQSNNDSDILVPFEILPFSMQWGVYVDFFDEKGIFLEDKFYWGGTRFMSEVYEQFDCENDKCTNLMFKQEDLKTRQEARKAALDKAIEIYNGSK